MFWLLSKIFWLVFHPLSLTMILVALGLLLALRRRKGFGLTLVALGLFVLMVSGLTTTGALLLQPLEARYERPVSFPEDAKGIIVLGGGTKNEVSAARRSYQLAEAGERYVEAVRLALAHDSVPILIAGGIGSLDDAGESDAKSSARLFEAFGIDPERIRTESLSRNTYENAVNSAELLDPRQGDVYVLITSAYHMPRALALYQKAGFDVVAWPVDYRTTGEEGFTLAIGDGSENVSMTATAIHEWIGLITYWATGRTDAVFP